MAQVPIQPFVYLDSRMLQPVQSYRFHPGTIRVRVLDAIETTGLTSDNVEELQERVYKIMEEVILSEDKDFKGRS
jgi:1-acyl-sn-glycerol-3-phosphate acyltransferase